MAWTKQTTLKMTIQNLISIRKKKKKSLMKESADFNGVLLFSKRTETMLEEEELKKIIISENCVYFNNSLWLLWTLEETSIHIDHVMWLMWYLKILETILKVKHLKGKVLFIRIGRICSDNSQDGFFLLKKVDGKTESWKDRVWVVTGEGVYIIGQKICQTLNLFDRGYSEVYMYTEV